MMTSEPSVLQVDSLRQVYKKVCCLLLTRLLFCCQMSQLKKNHLEFISFFIFGKKKLALNIYKYMYTNID